MEAFTTIAQDWFGFSLLVGVIVLIYGGNMLVNGGVTIAKQLGISTLVIGLTIVAFSTSSPELALNIIASMNGNTDLSLGNVFGSNIANLGLVLGIGALICKLPITGQVVNWEFPWLFWVTIFVGAITVVCSFDWMPELLRGLGFIWGLLFLLLFLISMWKWFSLGKKQSVLGEESKDVIPDEAHKPFIGWCMLIGGFLLLATGGKLTEIGAVEAATRMGISQIVIGVTIVAIATSLPEIVTTIIAAKQGHPDLAVGNVVGSNLFNLLLVLPVTMFVHKIDVPTNAWVYVVVMIIMTWIALRITKDERIKPIEGGILLGLYFFFIAGLVAWKTMS